MDLFSITPTEAAIWNLTITGQSKLSAALFGNIQFLSICILAFAFYFISVMNKTGPSGREAVHL